MPHIAVLVAAMAFLPLQDSLGSFWNRLNETTDPATVRTLVLAGSASSRERGLALLRIYQLTQASADGAEAERTLAPQLEQHPGDPWLQFAYGEALAIKSPRDFPLRAAKYLLEALRLDTLHLPAAQALARLALASREKELLLEVRRAGERITRSRPNVELLNLLAEVAREQRDPDRANQHAIQALAAAPVTARALYNLAIAQLSRPQTMDEGYYNYLQAADRGDTAVWQRMRAELALIGDVDEQPPSDTGANQPSALLETFWQVRSVRDGRRPAERVAEHYRRIAYARDKFYAKHAITYMEDALNWNKESNLGFDDRGRVYIRYGEPTRVLRVTDTQNFNERMRTGASSSGRDAVMSNANAKPTGYFETWTYDLPERERIIFHFQLPDQAGRGYLLSKIPGCGVWLGNHQEMNGQYALLATKCGSGSAVAWSVEATLRDMNLWYQEQADLALKSDAFVAFYRRELTVDGDVYAFRSADGAREYAIAVALPAVPALRRADGYRFDLRVTAADTVLGFTQQFDTTIVYPSARALGATDFFRFTNWIKLDSAHAPFYRVQVIAADSTYGRSFYGALPTFLPKGFDISDIVLGEPAAGGTFVRGPIRLNVMPSRVFASANFRIFYEIYGLAAGTEYQTTITIAPNDSGVRAALRKIAGSETITLAFPGTVTTTESWRQQELRTIETTLAPGTYKITVTVQDNRNGAQALKTREFRVVE